MQVSPAGWFLNAVYPNCFNTNPDPAFYLNADPDPDFYLNAEPDPSFYLNAEQDQAFIVYV